MAPPFWPSDKPGKHAVTGSDKKIYPLACHQFEKHRDKRKNAGSCGWSPLNRHRKRHHDGKCWKANLGKIISGYQIAIRPSKAPALLTLDYDLSSEDAAHDEKAKRGGQKHCIKKALVTPKPEGGRHGKQREPGSSPPLQQERRLGLQIQPLR